MHSGSYLEDSANSSCGECR